MSLPEWVKDRLCDYCGEQPATIKVIITNIDGEVTDSGQYCGQCARDIIIVEGHLNHAL